MKFRKKPVVIEAVQLSTGNWQQIENWSHGKVRPIGDFTHPNDIKGMNIQTLEGVMFAEPSDWIIRGIKGEFYPCKPDIFAATYEEVAE